jgi:UTP-glucose-1-phosphate uridylyltransferase
MRGDVRVCECTRSVFPITEMIEKPAPGKAPWNLIIAARTFQPEIFQGPRPHAAPRVQLQAGK